MLNVGFAKLGKSIKFRRHVWNTSGGDNEPLALLQSLANNYPENRYYLLGRSDWSKMTHPERRDLFPHGNVIDCWEGCDIKQGNHRKGTYIDDIDPAYDTWLLERLATKFPPMDHSVMLVGQMCIANLRGITKLKNDQSRTCSPLVMGVLYALPVMRWVNETKPRYIEVITDQLYDLSQPRDLIHFPTHSLGQLDCVYETLRMKSYEDQEHIITKVPSNYAPVETLFCVGRAPSAHDNERDIPFAVVCNERRPSRFPMLREWILDQFRDVAIYGRWAEGRGSKTLDAQAVKIANDSRFRGSLHIDELHGVMSRVKTTFVVPQHRGGATSKWVEMLHSGVVPFFHPDYDKQSHVRVPEFLRPPTPRALRERVEIVLSDDAARVQLVENLRTDLLHEGFYDGSVVGNTIMSLVHRDLGLSPPTRDASVNWLQTQESSIQELFA